MNKNISWENIKIFKKHANKNLVYPKHILDPKHILESLFLFKMDITLLKNEANI